jgi:hypothetical protein
MAEATERMEPDFAAFLGIDWADQRHAWALQTTTQKTTERGDLNHTPEAVDAWATELGQRFGGRPIAIALEQSRGSLLFMLTKYAHFVLYPIHPTTLVNYRRGFRPSGAKSDPSDAGLLLDLVVRHREKLRPLHPDTAETRTLQLLVEGRRKLVHDKTRYSNRLTACLKMYFPQALEWFSEVSSQVTGDFLERWPTLQKLQKARPGTLRTFFLQRHSCTSENIDHRLEEIRRAVPATHDPAVITAGVATALAVVRLPGARATKIVRRELGNAQLCGMLLDNVPDDLFRNAVTPCLARFTDASKNSSKGDSSRLGPLINHLFYPV